MTRPRHVAGAIAVAAGLAGCGGTSQVTILNTEKVERAIEQSIMHDRGLESDVSCPSGVHQKRGLTFVCNAQIRQGTTPFVVKQVDNRGDVSYTGQ